MTVIANASGASPPSSSLRPSLVLCTGCRSSPAFLGMPERFAQAALGHNSKAIHRAYAKKAIIIAPSLEEYEAKAAAAKTQTVVAA